MLTTASFAVSRHMLHSKVPAELLSFEEAVSESEAGGGAEPEAAPASAVSPLPGEAADAIIWRRYINVQYQLSYVQRITMVQPQNARFLRLSSNNLTLTTHQILKQRISAATGRRKLFYDDDLI